MNCYAGSSLVLDKLFPRSRVGKLNKKKYAPKKFLPECGGFIISTVSGITSLPQIPRSYAELSIFDLLLSFTEQRLTKSDFPGT